MDEDIYEARRRAIVVAIEELRDLCRDGCALGLGTGSTMMQFIETLAKLNEVSILRKSVVYPSSRSTASKLLELGVAPSMIDTYTDRISIDIYIDSADEVDRRLFMIKGGGGALLREKVLTMLSKTSVFIVDYLKLSDYIGSKKPVPIEVSPPALPLALKTLKELGFQPRVRASKTSYGATYSDNGNVLVDLATGPLKDPESVDRELMQIPGIVVTGIFLNKYVSKIVVGYRDRVDVLTP